MKLARSIALTAIVLASSVAIPSASAQQKDWLNRCNNELTSSSMPESGNYLFQTVGKVADPARVEFDYTTGVSARAAEYPTTAKDLLNPYSSASLSLGYYAAVDGAAPHAAEARIGHVSVGFIGKDFKPIPGTTITITMVLDGVTFGPYPANPSSMSSGMYTVWLDTAQTDGDSKPPILESAAFGRLAKAIDRMKTAQIGLAQDGEYIVRAKIPFPQLATWRDGLAAWASKTKPGVGAATFCSAGGNVVN